MNAILLSIRAPIGYVSRLMLPMAFNQGCRAIITSRSLLPEFLVYALLALREELEAAGRGTTFMELSAAQTASLEVPVPPVEEQRRIVQRLDEQTATVDTLIAKAERFIELSKERRAALITAAVTGQLQIPA